MKDRRLVALREEDLPSFKAWRNAQQDFLRQDAPLTDADQARWYRESVVPSRSATRPALAMFSVLEDGNCVGYAGLTHIDWTHRRAEVVFLVDTARLKDVKRYQDDFAWCLGELKKTAFETLKLERLVMENYDLRPWHVEALERAGFKPEGRLRGHVVKGGRRLDSLLHGLLAADARA